MPPEVSVDVIRRQECDYVHHCGPQTLEQERAEVKPQNQTVCSTAARIHAGLQLYLRRYGARVPEVYAKAQALLPHTSTTVGGVYITVLERLKQDSEFGQPR